MIKRCLFLFLGAFALYALTAQRGLGWGDSGEFQYRILTLGAEGLLKGCDSFATAHPLYVLLGKLLCSTPYQVTLISSFFGAVAVLLLFLLTRSLPLAALFALAHGPWWLSTVSEVYTLSLAFFAAELLALKRFRATGGAGALFALAALNGLHLEVHNLALLSIPVYAWVVLCGRGALAASEGVNPSASDAAGTPRPRWGRLLSAAGVWCLAASFWLWAFFTLGPREVLFGSYGAQVLTLKPILPAAIPLNLALGGLSLAAPAAIVVLLRFCCDRNDLARSHGATEDFNVRFSRGDKPSSELLSGSVAPRESNIHASLRPWPLALGPLHFLFAIHFLFWSTYFIVSQYTFILPSALLAYLIAGDCLSRRAAPPKRVWAALFAVQLALPVAAWGALSAVGFPPDYRALHPGRDDSAYFALPWHVTDDTASRAAALRRTHWTGYP